MTQKNSSKKDGVSHDQCTSFAFCGIHAIFDKVTETIGSDGLSWAVIFSSLTPVIVVVSAVICVYIL